MYTMSFEMKDGKRRVLNLILLKSWKRANWWYCFWVFRIYVF